MQYSNATYANLMDAIYKSVNSAPKALARVAHYVATTPENIQNLSIGELARLTGSSQASIIRFSQSFGFAGYGEFKVALMNEIAHDKARRLETQADFNHVTIDEEIAPVHADFQRSLSETSGKLQIKQIRRLAEKIRNAKQIEIFGIGVSGICADLLTLRLIWLGISAHSFSTPTLSLGLAQNLDSKSLAIGISYGGLSEETRSFLATAGETGAHTLAITTRPDCPVAQTADETVLLSSVGVWPDSGSARLVPAMALLIECLANCLNESNDDGAVGMTKAP